MMDRRVFKRSAVAMVIAAGLAVGVLAQDAARGLEQEEGVTIVTSDRLTYDSQKQFALFEENVVVTDPQIQLTCKKLTLFFDENGEAKSIRAVNNVHIRQGNKRSVSGIATYDVASGKIVLSENPRINQGEDTLQADTITFWRDQDKMVCTGRARLVMSPKEDGARSTVFGE